MNIRINTRGNIGGFFLGLASGVLLMALIIALVVMLVVVPFIQRMATGGIPEEGLFGISKEQIEQLFKSAVTGDTGERRELTQGMVIVHEDNKLIIEVAENERVTTRYSFRYDEDTKFWTSSDDPMPQEVVIQPSEIKVGEQIAVTVSGEIGLVEDQYVVEVFKF